MDGAADGETGPPTGLTRAPRRLGPAPPTEESGLMPGGPRGVGVYSEATSEVSPTSTASSKG